MRKIAILVAVVGVGLAAAAAAPVFERGPSLETGILDVADLRQPDAGVKGVVFLVSGPAGYGAVETDMAAVLTSAGAIVVGLDMPGSIAKAEAEAQDGDPCTYFVSDLESVSRQVQRAADLPAYRDPIVAGIGAGGAMALGFAAQTPAATVGRTVAVDPTASFPMNRPLCTGAPSRPAAYGLGWVYGLQPGPLPDPIDVRVTSAADGPGRAHVQDLIAAGYGVTLSKSAKGEEDALLDAVTAALGTAAPDEGSLSDLPLVDLATQPTRDALAIVLSGDGGWRDIDSRIGETLAARGVPTVGLDSLRYFWSEKRPGRIAADLARVIDAYRERWHVTHVILVGYSFGADVLPAAYDALPPATRATIAMLSLLSFSDSADFELSVAGWFGDADAAAPTLPSLRKIDPRLVQCFYGAEDDEAACPRLAGTGVEVVRTRGGHHFDGDYEALADRILAGLDTRTADVAATFGRPG